MLARLLIPVELETRAGSVTLRRATAEDVDALMGLLSDDPVSASRGDVAADEDRAMYGTALRSVLDDPANDLLVVDDGEVVGTMQLTRIPGLSRKGSTRLLAEAVHVRSDRQSAGIGGEMMRWVQEVAAPALGAGLVQLTSDATRADAHRFYERLGFTPSHVGFKYRVPSAE